MSRRMRRAAGDLSKTEKIIAGTLIVIIALAAGTTMANIVFPSGWEAKAYMNTVVATGTRGQNAGDSKPYINNDQTQSVVAGTSYTKTFDVYGRTTAIIPVSNNEQIQWSQKATPSGSPDLSIELSAVKHCIINPLTGALMETTDYHAYVETYTVTYTGSDEKTHVWYGELHYYVFDFYARTAAKVLNDKGGIAGWGAVHEGNTAGSRGTAVQAIVNTVFEISPWVVVEANTRNFTFADGTESIGDYADGFAGILSATIWDLPQSGQVYTTDDSGRQVIDNQNGHARNLMSKGVMITMKDAQITVNWRSAQIKGLPSKVTLEIRTGDLMAGAYEKRDYGVRAWLTATDYYALYSNVVVMVLQQKDYVLRTGHQEDLNPTPDVEGEYTDWWDDLMGIFGGIGNFLSTVFWVAVFLIGLFLVVKLIGTWRGGARQAVYVGGRHRGK